MSNPDWNFEEPDADDCEKCGEQGKDECDCADPHEPDTLDEL